MYVHKIMYMLRYLCVHIIFISYLSYVEDYPTIQQLQNVMSNENICITTRWRGLGQKLLFNSNYFLSVIEADHPNNDKSCCLLMFEKWLEIEPYASWSQLVTALNNIKLNTAATVIKRYKLGTYIVMYYIYIYIYIYMYDEVCKSQPSEHKTITDFS